MKLAEGDLPLKNYLVFRWHRYDNVGGILGHRTASFSGWRVGCLEGNQDCSGIVDMPECVFNKLQG